MTPHPDQLPLLQVNRSPQMAAPAQGRGRRAIAFLLLSLAVLLVLMTPLRSALFGRQSDPAMTGQGQNPAIAQIVGLGKILPASDVITLAPPFGAGDARLQTLLVKEGDTVAAGAPLAVLDNQASFTAALQSAKAAHALREAVFAQVKATIAASRREAQASLARAELAAKSLARDFERTEQLHRTGAATDALYDQRRSQRDEAVREVERLIATLSRFDDMSDNQPDILVARRQVDAAHADLMRAEADLDKATLRAPLAATILAIHHQPGERPGAFGVMTLGDLSAMKVEAEIYQNAVSGLALGQRASVSADALGAEPLQGSLTRIGLEVGRQTLTDASPAANTDARVLHVIISLDAAGSRRAARFVNLQVLARIQRDLAP